MNKLLKRVLSLAVVAAMAVAMLPTVFADTPAYTDWDGSQEAIVDGAYLKLTADVNLNDRLTFIEGKKVTIDLNGNTLYGAAGKQILYIAGGAKVTVLNGTLQGPGLTTDAGSSAPKGGLIMVSSTSGNELTLENVKVYKTAGTSALTDGGGVLYARGNVTLKNSEMTVLDQTGHDPASLEGGLIKISTGCTLTIENSRLYGGSAKTGGGIFATGSSKVIINGNTNITGNTAIGNGGDLYAGNAKTTYEINSGVIGEFNMRSATATIANGVVSKTNPSNYATNSTALLFADGAYTVCADLPAALAAASAGSEVIATAKFEDDTAELTVPAGVTLNLGGFELTAKSLTAAFEDTHVVNGEMNLESASLNADNKDLIIEDNGYYVIESVSFKEQLTVENNKAVYKFYVDKTAADTILDACFEQNGAYGLTIEVKVTWTNANNEAKEKIFVLDANDAAKLAADWDNKMVILTINDLTGVSDLTCTAQISSSVNTVTA